MNNSITIYEPKRNNSLTVYKENLDLFFRFVTERQNIFYKRFVEKLPQPWTNDEILRKYKFTNVYRELDRGTLYVKNEIIGRGKPEDVIFNILIYRIFNKIESHRAIGFQHVSNFDADKIYRTLKKIEDSRKPVFTNAFMVSGAKYGGYEKKLPNMVYGVIQNDIVRNFDRYFYGIINSKSLEEAHSVIKSITHFGDFLAYEAVIDINYSGIIKFSEDDWVNAGPGCRRGLDYIFKCKDAFSYADLIKILREDQRFHFERLGLHFKFWHGNDLTLRNVEHSLCEFSKYYRLLTGADTRIRKFKQSEENLKIKA